MDMKSPVSLNSEYRFYEGPVATCVANGIQAANFLGDRFLRKTHRSSSEIDELLLQQKTEHKTTLIIVTHDVRGARRVGDRFAVLDKGTLAAIGPVSEVEQSENDVARELVRE